MFIHIYSKKVRAKEKQAKLFILLPEKSVDSRNIKRYYLKFLKKVGIDKEYIVIMGGDDHLKNKKETIDFMDNNVYPLMTEYGANSLLVANAAWFKNITGETASAVKGKYISNLSYSDSFKNKFNVAPLISYGAFFYNASSLQELPLYIEVAPKMIANLPVFTGIRFKTKTVTGDPKIVSKCLKQLLKIKKPIAIDIEAFSLEFHTAGVGTISLAKSAVDAVGFYVDYMPLPIYNKFYKHLEIIEEYPDMDAVRIDNVIVKKLLKKYFNKTKSKKIYHNITYDAVVLIYELFIRKNLRSRKLLIKGLEKLAMNYVDTYHLCFLALNSAQPYRLSLKENIMSYAGNYAISVNDITLQRPRDLLDYNCVDSAGTYWLYEEMKDVPKKQNQVYLHENVLTNGGTLFCDIHLSGIPIDIDAVNKLENDLTKEREFHYKKLQKSSIVSGFLIFYRATQYFKQLLKWKAKSVPFSKFEPDTEFNPGSSNQLSTLLYDYYELPVFNETKAGNPSTDKSTFDTLMGYVKSTNNESIKKILMHIQDLSDMSTILNTFLPAFKKFSIKVDGHYQLFGKFRFPSTVSGRPTSNNPNMLNLPSTGSTYAKHIKTCIKVRKGKLLVGADYDSQEHKVNALITGDPNMQAEYTSGLDGHSLRAIKYFAEEMPDIAKKVKYADKYKNKKKYYKDSKGNTFNEDEL